MRNLAFLDQSDWVARITAVNPKATSIPPVLPNETPEQRIARFAKVLAKRFESRYTTTAFAGRLTKASSSSFKTKTELSEFLTANPTLNLKSKNVDQFIATNKLTISSPALAELKVAQRLLRLSPHYTSAEALNGAGYQSAQSVYFRGRTAFIAEMTTALGSASLAKMAYARSQMIYAKSLAAFSRYNGAFNSVAIATMISAAPDPASLDGLPDLQQLFGSLDYFQCGDCQSVLSPAAYLVDLLVYLSWFKASGGGVSNARDALFARRPDIQFIALGCNNTNITMPYIDLVNEIYEAAVAPPATAATLIDTTGTSAERRALPQQISQAAYASTQSAVFPFGLPFDLPFAQTTAYLAAIGTTRAAVLELFALASPALTAIAVAGAQLGLNPEMQQVVTGGDGKPAWAHWGLPQAPTSVTDPKTRLPYSPNPASWIAALAKVPVFLDRSGLSLPELLQLVEVVWVTQRTVTLEPARKAAC